MKVTEHNISSKIRNYRRQCRTDGSDTSWYQSLREKWAGYN